MTGMQSAPDDRFYIAGSPGGAEIRVLGSRFLAEAVPADTAEAADTHITAVRKRHHDATHVVSGIVLQTADGRIERSSDDGEPSGTGGRPVLAEIDRAGLLNVVVTVTRWFGGKKLGTGRLARAYAEAAAAALAACKRTVRRPMRSFRLTFPYPLESVVLKSLQEVEGATLDGGYGDRVTLTVQVPASAAERFAALITDRSAGSIVCEDAPGS